ncbi:MULTISPECIES: acetyl-CoA hydrolase/transferase family protein [unclassified Variovorax]|uniref:acetyl-CoA hydrolase/transferase family protein n=1 Tax=unclassified Variovorax TaxID=663243 RepID=UPI003F4691CB
MARVESLAGIDLATYIRPGDGIVFGQGTGEPLSLTEQLVAQRAGFSGAGIFFGSGFSSTFKPEHADHLRFKGIGGIGTLRKLSSAGVLDPVPCHISAVADLIEKDRIRTDVVMLLVSPANERGEHSFGLVNDYVRTAISRARVVIAEVSSQVPWTPCDAPLKDDEITVAVHTDRAPLELPAAKFGELERRIAAHVADLIPDRATLQMGIGAVPEAIVSLLIDRRDLGVHSGMVGDSLVDLVESGAVTNAHKGMDEGVSVTGVLFGTQRLYRFAHRNPQLRLCPTRYTHHMATLSRVKNLVSVNSALEVDLTGQVNAEAIGPDYIGAVGGQVDFVRAAVQSEGGVSIVALGATGKTGDSKIVGRLSGPVTTARSDVDVIATEHGIARLRGLGLRERVKAMVAIAAPEHRDALMREARDLQGTTC